MAHELLLNNIGKHIELDSEEIQYVLNQFKDQEYKRGCRIQNMSSNCKEIHFVESGMLRAYFTTDEGKESTIMFAKEDWWITDMHAFANEQPAMLAIEAVRPSKVLSLSKERLNSLFEAIPKFERFFRILMQNAYIREQLRVIQNLSLPAEKRYANFIERYPQIAQHVTQKQIASYLGITPEFLSTIRAGRG